MESQTKQGGHILKKRGKSIAIMFLVLISTLTFPSYLDGQENNDIKFEHISIEQGLSQNTIYCISQDSRGFMWFGTQNGLNRYDGYTFNLYENDGKDPKSLSHNLVRSICEDQLGMMWVGTWGGGLNKFNRANEEFETYKNSPDDPTSISNNNVMSIYKDKFGTLWIGTDDGLNRYNQETKKFTNYKNNNGYHRGKVRAIKEDLDGVLWIGTDRGLQRYNRKEDNFETYQIDPIDSFCNKVRAICEDEYSRILWIGTERGLYKFNRKDGISIPCYKIINDLSQLSDKNINTICENQKDILWIGTRSNGIYRFNPKGGKITHHRYIPNNSNSLSHDDVRAIYEDNSELIWVGTFGGGLNKFDYNKRKKFNLFRNNPNNKNSLSNNTVMVIRRSSTGNIWIGTMGGGIDEFNSKTKKFTNYKIGSNVSNNPHRNDIRAIEEDHLGRLWVGTVHAGLYKFIPKERRFYLYKDRYIGEEEYILSIYKDQSGVLWIGTLDGGLIKIDKNRKPPKNYKNIHGDTNSLSNDKVYSIYEDKSGVLWVGTGGGGLNKFDREKEVFTSYLASEKKPNSLSHNFISAIYEDKAGKLWIGTNGGGLNKFDREKESSTVYTTQHGLPNNVIYDILEDSTGCLWLSTNRGLSKFDPKTGEFRNYTVIDGLQGYEFNRWAAFKDKDSGEMFFGGLNGFNSFYPDRIEYNRHIPPIVITDFKIANKSVPIAENSPLMSHITETNELTLSYKETILSFKFAALDYTAPEKNRYRYKLEGYTENWVDLGNKHEINLPNLEPGKYILKIQGANNNGLWNEEGTSIDIKINHPLWATFWFKILLFVVLISCVLPLVILRIRNIKKDRKEPSALFETLKNREAFAGIITKNRKMLEIFEYIETIATTELPVLITGETGTGKELIAGAIHKASGRKGKFVAKNIAVMDDALFSKQLYGHKKSLLSYLKLKRKGWVEQAKDGTLFLDEIGDISTQSQVTLLGLIPEREFISPGTETQLPTGVRLVVATNKDIIALTKNGKFRKDIYYRLIYRIHLPPLRERKEDIPLLVEYFLKETAKMLNMEEPRVPKELFTLLSDYDFPGNVRELAGMVSDAMNRHQSGDLSIDIFRGKIREQSGK